MTRIEIESELNESRNWLLSMYSQLSPEQLHRPLTPSEHDPSNLWSALDHFAHLALIEVNFASMIRRHLVGHANPVGLLTNDRGETRTREEIMATVHEMTDEFQSLHRSDSLSQVVALTQAARSATLALLSELSDERLKEKLPGAPWADGTIGGVIKTNAHHARMHWGWISETSLLGT